MASTISQELIDKIASYDFSHDSFETIKAGFINEIGDSWHSDSTEIIESMDIANKEGILENVTQIVNYDGALAAWEEGHELLEHKDDVTIDYLNERLPAIEYWLGFFDGGGDELLQNLKSVIDEKNNPSQNEIDTTIEQEVVVSEDVADLVPEVVADNVVATSELEVKTDDVIDATSEVSVLPEAVVENVATIPESELATENMIEDAVELPAIENIDSGATADPILNDTSIDDAQAPAQLQAQNNIESFFETTSDLENTLDSEHIEENVEASAMEEPVAQEVVNETIAVPVAPIEDGAVAEESLDAQESDANFVVTSVTSSDTNISNVKSAKSGLEAIPLEEPLASSNPTHWEWYVNRFLRLNDYYDQTISRTSARCVGLGGISLADYPYFEYILDVLSELIDMGKQILAKPAVHNLIKERVPKGIKGLEEIIKAYEAEFNNNAPPEMLDKSADMAMVKARLGQLVENTVEEDIGPAPDGFVVEDEPSISFS